MKTVLQLDPQGYIVGLTTADESPLEEGVYLIPGGAVDAPPPVLAEGQRALFSAGAWLVEDIPQPPPPTPTEQPPPEVPGPRRFTSLEFLDLFTEAEQVAIALAAMGNVQAKLWYDRALAAMFITLADPRTEVGLNALVTAGLLTAERKAAIAGAMSPEVTP